MQKMNAAVRAILSLALPALVPAVVAAQPLVLQPPEDPSQQATASAEEVAPAAPTESGPALVVEPAPPVAAPAAPAPAAPAPAAPAVAVPVPAPAVPATAVAAPPPPPPVVTAPAADPKLSDGRILIMRFQPVNPNETNPWVGRSVQESLAADLTVAAPARVEMVDEAAPTIDAALAAGRSHHARFVVAGGFVTADKAVRITGQILDVETGRAVGGLKATGLPAQIFRLEDTLASQIRSQILPDSRPVEQPAQTAQSTGVRTDGDYGQSQTPSSSTYSTAPTSSAYGAGSTTYTYTTPGYYDSGSYYPDYSTPYYGDSYVYPGIGFYIGPGIGRPFLHPPLRAFRGGPGFAGRGGGSFGGRGPVGGPGRGMSMSRGGGGGGHGGGRR